MGVRNSVRGLEIRPFTLDEEEAVIALWARCSLIRPWNDPHKDIRRKLAVQPGLLLVALIDGSLAATVMAGYEGHCGWINYLAVAPEVRRAGVGRALMERAEELLRAVGCPKINVQVRAGNTGAVEFYRHLGYRVDDVLSMGKRLEQDGLGSS